MIASPNHSSRGGATVIWVVIHTAEGARTVESLGAYFAKTTTQASSHVGIDDNRIEQYVDYSQAAWTLRNGNSRSDNAELCGFAAWSRDQWLNEHRHMLELAAQWIRERCQARGIPIRHLTPAQVAAGESGVIGHYDYTLGARDGSHTDPGPGFPWDTVLGMAVTGGPTPAPQPAGRSVVDILAAGGIQRPAEVVELAAAAGLELAAAATMLDKESGGGANIWGHDGVVVAPNTYTKGGPVTEANYRAYKTAVLAGKAGRQGCGPTQLTYGGFQDQADVAGGCWDWRANVATGFGILAGYIKSRGPSGGFRAYNAGPGATGSAGVAYAADAVNRYNTWRGRLANATEDDMTPQESARLARVEHALEILVQQVCGETATIENPFPGADKGGGWQCHDGERRTLVDIGRHGLEQLDGA